MNYRYHSTEKISEIGLGGYALSGAYGEKDLKGFIEVVRRPCGLGVTFFDIAYIYGSAEEILGRAVKTFREQVWIATKVGGEANGKPDCSSGHILASCNRSLSRLGTDFIDLYQLHFSDPRTPVEETVAALEKLKSSNKIRYYGVGNILPERMQAFFTGGTFFSDLLELSAVSREARRYKLPLCQRSGVGVIDFSVTGRGLLTGKIRKSHTFSEGDIRRMDPLFQRELLGSGLRVMERFRALGEKLGKSPVQVGIAWVMAQSGVMCALTGPSNLRHMEENLGASDLKFESEELETLNRFFSQEDMRLRREQRQSMCAILEELLRAETAFPDLIYFFETLIENGFAKEDAIIPLFQKLFTLRGQAGPAAFDELEIIQAKLRQQYLALSMADNQEPG